MNKVLIISCLIASGIFWNTALAEITISNLMSSSRSVPESEDFDPDYQFVKDNYPLANTAQLFYAAVVESHLGNSSESLRYLLAGQIRSSADMELFEPASEVDKSLMADLWGMIFYQFGGAGGNEIYKDKAKYSKVFKNISAYNPELVENYNPGWEHKGIPRKSEYLAKIEQAKAHRLKQLNDLVALLKNDEYVALDKELKSLKQSPENSKRSLEIINRMREISGAPKIPIPE